MTKFTQISAAALAAVFASTAFVSTAQATGTLRVCNVTSTNVGDEVRRGCAGPQNRRLVANNIVPGAAAGPIVRTQNFRGLSAAELKNIAIKEGKGGGQGRGGNP